MPTVLHQSIDDRLRETAIEAVAAAGPSDTPSHPALARLCELGTKLWLDTGNLEEAAGLWHAEFSALTTNNTLANQVVQTGVMDDLAREFARSIRAAKPGLSDADFLMELGFVINCHIALRLVKAFGTQVSVELHPAVSEDVEKTVWYAKRYFAICPERFIIKIPLTPEGYCAVSRVRAEGIPVNYTLGFSARQNVLAALISNPSYCNVFLGRLNAVVADNAWGDGAFVGEKACMATQRALRELRVEGRSNTQLIAASMRATSQVFDLAGTDVYTIPPKVARGFLQQNPKAEEISSQLDREFTVSFANGSAARQCDILWDLDESFTRCASELASRGGKNLTPDDLRQADRAYGTRMFRAWQAEELDDIRSHGKIPRLDRWTGTGVALDDLMTRSALLSFEADQEALDNRLASLSR